MATYTFHAADSRGEANHGWLQSRHTFSFGGYHNPERIHFGALRVLNDDIVAGGQGFGAHPHDNMEIISIPLAGALEHQDSMGNRGVIQHGDIQVMSAGTGIQHAEYNGNNDQEVRFLQIWVIPNVSGVEPRHDQLTLDVADRHNKFQQVISPDQQDAGLWIYQNAWFHLADFDAGFAEEYTFKSTNAGLYIFNLSGTLEVDGQKLESRDGLGITEASSVSIKALSNASFLLMEVPLL